MPTLTAELSGADRRRLHHAFGHDRFSASDALFPDDSINRRINGEIALLLGGGRALLMQIAHPLVAEGVANFSNFRTDPLGRLWRTLELTLAITFAPAGHAMRSVREIERAHGKVHGALKEAVGPFPAGTTYHATDSELMFWVQATLIDSAILVYDRFVQPLSRAEREAYYEGGKQVARILGIEERHIPGDYDDFRDYLADMLEGDTLTVGPAGREVAEGVLFPKRPPLLSEAVYPVRELTFELLPPVLRGRFGVERSTIVSAACDAFSQVSRVLLPWLPAPMRAMPYAAR